MKIGIVGGTFNPIHLGHLMLGEYAYEACNLDKVWFMPNGNPPHKNINTSGVSIAERTEMTKLAIQDVEHFEFNSYEIQREEISYSYQTIQEFTHLYPKAEFYFIIGSDSLFSLEEWRCPEELLQLCTILVACRENIDIDVIRAQITHLNHKYNCAIMLLQMPLLEISSSDIRRRVALNQSIKYIVPDCVCSYIKDKKMYKELSFTDTLNGHTNEG